MLLDLCKATEMRIVNGRIFCNTDKMTCFTPNGESLIDYIVTGEYNFASFSNVTVHDYNEFSNHAPISFCLKIGTQRSGEATTKYRKAFIWKEEYKMDFVNSLKNDLNLLQNIVDETGSLDCIVDKFSTFITDRANPYFEKIIKVNQENVFSCSDFKETQKWFNQTCKLKKEKLQEAIRDFNLQKNEQNRRKVFECRKDYRYYCRNCKQKFKRNRCKQMDDLRKKKPKEFWKLFKKKRLNTHTNLSENDFFEYFQQLSSEISDNNPEEVIHFMQSFDNTRTERDATFLELDEPISRLEIKTAISNLSTNKSSGIDNIVNEYFKHAAEILLEPLHTLFNKILNSGSFPTQWATGVVVPIHKKGDFDDPNNYRGITLISCFAKLFISVLNKRLETWSKENDNSSDAQFGFKANHSTIDAVFILKFLIDQQLQTKKKLYCAFIDLKKSV